MRRPRAAPAKEAKRARRRRYASSRAAFARCDGDEDGELADEHDIAAFPAIALFKRGARTATFKGRPGGVALTAWIEEHVPHFSVVDL